MILNVTLLLLYFYICNCQSSGSSSSSNSSKSNSGCGSSSNHMPITLFSAIISMHCSTASVITCFFSHTQTHTFSSVSMLYYTLDAQLSLKPQDLPHSKHIVSIMINCFFTSMHILQKTHNLATHLFIYSHQGCYMSWIHTTEMRFTGTHLMFRHFFMWSTVYIYKISASPFSRLANVITELCRVN